jgi:CBS domain-containing protein
MKTAIDVLNFSSYKKNEIKPDDDIITALNLMVKNKIDFVVVSFENEYYGLLTEVACLKNYIANFKKSKNIKVKELMLKDLPYINHYDSIENCLKLMITYNVNFIPVFNDINFCGIITMKDILLEIENTKFQGIDEFELKYA